MSEDVKELLHRANAQRHEERKPALERRYIYGGDRQNATPAGPTPARLNKRITRRRFSTFNTIVLLFSLSLVIVLYVNNILTIDQLASDIGKLQARYAAIQNTNAALRAEINRKSSWERIGRTATEQLGLVFPKEQPLGFSIDESALQRVTNR
ncbi:MAG TPA: septum formation initiator family protein [Bacteroidota bacterium]|nr:septum formation initiator family protein [Bacteroidota bacterium]